MTDRTPYCHKIRYGITGAPILTDDEMDGSHAPGVGIAPALIELVYSAPRDGKPPSVSASVTGAWTRFGRREDDSKDDQVTTHFKNGPDGWPEWLAAEARLHDPDTAATPSVPADADLRTLIRGVIRDCPAEFPDDIADRVWAALESAYRSLLTRLEADRAGHLRAAGRAKEAGGAELLLVSDTFAAAMAVRAFEGPDAAQAYMQRTGGEEVVPVDDDLRDRIAEAVVPLLLDRLPKVIARSRGYEVADVVLAILPAPADRAAEERRLRAKVYEWQGSYLDEVKVRQHRDEEIARLCADRAAVLREAADELAEDDFLLAADELRRMAVEAQQADTAGEGR